MVSAIIAMSDRGRIIGNGNDLPWHIPGDLKFFKSITMGSTVVMGRKTWDSLPESVKPLPGRKNIVVSKSKEVSGNPDQVMTLGEFNFMPINGQKVYIIGGAEIIEKTLSMTMGIHLTRVYGDFDGDKKMPKFEHLFVPQVVGRMRESNGIRYRHELWSRLQRVAKINTLTQH